MKKKFFILLAFALPLLAPLAVASPAYAVDLFGGACDQQPNNPVCEAEAEDSFIDLMGNIINTLLVLIGIAAVIYIIIGGFRYVTAQGDSGQLTSAKNTILYAVIGLVVAIASFAIVNFVLGRF